VKIRGKLKSLKGNIMSREYAISVMSKDRTGIIADITTVIYDFGGDLKDLNQSVLRGYFTMILIAEFNDTVSKDDLLNGFLEIESDTALEAVIKEISDENGLKSEILPGETYILTAQAKNRKGLVSLLGKFFYTKDINVLDLVTAHDDVLYTMIFQVDLSAIASMKDLRNDLSVLEKDEQLELVLQHNDIYKATNEVGAPLDTLLGI